MPSTRDIRRRIRSVKNTAQITKAMQMVASSKMRKAQLAALAGRPYAILMNQVILNAAKDAGQNFTQPLMETRPIRKRAVLAVSTDKGLCGALNANLGREALKYEKETTVYVAAGRKAAQLFARTKRNLNAEFTYKDAPLFAEARAMSKTVQEMFLKGEVDSVDVVFTRFVNTLTQKVEVRQLLPIGKLENILNLPGGPDENAQTGDAQQLEHLFEPSAEQVLGAILPHFVNFIVYQILLEAKASEHSARMVAMKNATDNAKQLIKDLTLEYNKLRQANITKELLEITTAQMALG
ncbi:MAG TPA: ATP synthase F1 subunit gamma [Candidatus Angelobacter sp.]|nr:ATP synthase F1 subunit gamma [Candidatus Angelobacter sp.]